MTERLTAGGTTYARVLMEQVLNRKLERTELVHHKNEDPGDDRIENLEVVTKAEHNRIHFEGKKHSEDHCKNISLGQLGKTTSEETKNKIRLAHLGKSYSDEVNKKKGVKGNKNALGNRFTMTEEQVKKRIESRRKNLEAKDEN